MIQPGKARSARLAHAVVGLAEPAGGREGVPEERGRSDARSEGEAISKHATRGVGLVGGVEKRRGVENLQPARDEGRKGDDPEPVAGARRDRVAVDPFAELHVSTITPPRRASDEKPKHDGMPMATITITVDGAVARVTLARPDVRNAFNAEVIRELREAFTRSVRRPAMRAVVLAGEGKVFCGGADINWMRGALDLSYDENVADAERDERHVPRDRSLQQARDRAHPRRGARRRRGSGGRLRHRDRRRRYDVFGFTEVKLGIIPAVISPFVLAKIGASHARALFLTGERFDAATRAARSAWCTGRRRRTSSTPRSNACSRELRSAGPQRGRRGKDA